MRKQYTLNTKFFREWSPEMSYLLGYLYADGNMARDKYRISFSSKDYDQLEMVKKLLESDRPITEESNKNGKWFTYNFQNKEMYNDLRKLGIFPNKSLTMRLPKIPKIYQRDFIRGYFDGDGCIYEVKRKRPTPGLELDFATGSKQFAYKFAEMLKKITNQSFRVAKKNNNYYRIRGANKASEALYEIIYYSDTIPFLKRKKDKYDSILTKRNYFLNLLTE